MSSCGQSTALMRKNFILMKRSPCATCCEIVFPIVLMLLLALVKTLFSTTNYDLKMSDSDFLQSNSSAFPSLQNTTYSTVNSTFYNLTIKNGRLYINY